MMFKVCVTFAVLVANVLATLPTSYDVDVKRYSYICVKTFQDLCLGISPGDGEPFYNESAPVFPLQVKKRLKNEEQALDYKKTRWDVRFQENMISLSRFPNLCISLPGEGTNNNKLALYPCDQVDKGLRMGKWSMEFNTNVNEESSIEALGSDQCITVMGCDSQKSGFCNPENDAPAVGFRSGAYVKTKPCWWSVNGNIKWKDAQTFVQAIDCAVGCPPMLQKNNVCDHACANQQCKLDNGRCTTAAPTPPTESPTFSPTFTPTLKPTTMSPTSSPATSIPTFSPTSFPTTSPVVPTESPTGKRTKDPTTMTPTKSPQIKPTKPPTSARPTNSPTTPDPTSSPSANPTASPTKSPAILPVLKKDPTTPVPTSEAPAFNAAIAVGVAVPMLLLLLLCLVFLLVARERRKRVQRDPKAWNSLIDVNQAAYVEHHRNKHQSIWSRMKRLVTGKTSEPPGVNVTALSSHLPVDHIIVTAVPGGWEPANSGSFKNKRRPKLVGSTKT